jgi:hypothetical protein
MGSSFMGEIRHKISVSLTRGADMREVLIKSLTLATLSALFNLPYFYYLIFSTSSERHPPINVSPMTLLLTETFLLFLVCLLSAMTGFSFSRKLGLPGLGDKESFVRSIPLLLTLGAVMVTFSYLLFDRQFFMVSPTSYPKDLIYLILFPLKGAFTEEVILRLCLVTLGVGLLRNRVAGVVLVSLVASFFTLKYFQFLGIDVGMNRLTITQILLCFVSNMILGYLFVTRGLMCAMALKYLVGMRYILVTWILR